MGPKKVIDNFISGLEILKENYTINSSENKNDEKNVFLQSHNMLSLKIENSIIGPNICTLPIDNKYVMEQKYKKILVPSEWVKKLYMKWLPEEKIEIWPVGIDTELFADKSNDKKEFDCLVYFKRRNEEDLKFVENFLKESNQTYNVIKYGHYNESNFLDLISKSKYGFIIDNCESQGIAIQEMMSCNLPLIVWDVKYWNDRGEEYKVEATSIPYFNSLCGIYFYEKEEIYSKWNHFIRNLESYKPRNYILENLNLEKQSKQIIKL